MKNNKKTIQFLLKIMQEKNLKKSSIPDFVNTSIREWNLKLYPKPEYLGINEILLFYGKLLNWRKVGNWSKEGTVRTKKVRFLLPTSNTLFDEKNPNHIEKGWHEKDYYAKEDFMVLIEKNNLLKSNNLKIKEVETKDGRLGIYRNFRKSQPDQKEIENLSDSFSTFVAYLAIKKIKDEAQKQNFTPEEVMKFTNLIDNIVPIFEDV